MIFNTLFLTVPRCETGTNLRMIEHDGFFYCLNSCAVFRSRDKIHWSAVLKDLPTHTPMNQNLPIVTCCKGLEDILCLPLETVNEEAQLSEAVEKLRIWKRQLHYESIRNHVSFPTRFSYQNRGWCDIDLLPVEEGKCEIAATCYEVIMTVDTGSEHEVFSNVLGVPLRYDVKLETLNVDGHPIPARRTQDSITIRVLIDENACLVLCAGKYVFIPHGISDEGVVVSCHGDSATLTALSIYGLRSPLMANTFPEPTETPLYTTSNYSVYPHHVVDKIYGEPFAYVPNRDTIYSPTRVIESFVWEHTPWGDMQRVNNRSDCWKVNEGVSRFPDVRTGIPTFDAAYRIALSVLDDACNDRFAIRNENGMWSAGGFQGPKFGFGVWRRDTAQIVMRAGNLLNPDCSRKSILYTLTSGFNNGMDGLATPVIALWDYYLATGDLEALREGWHALKENLVSAFPFFDEERSLFRTDRSSSNDAFEEIEAGGYHLSTEIYLMAAMEAAGKIAVLLGDDAPEAETFRRIGKAMRSVLAKEFYNPDKGFFCSGPRGSEAYETGCWETCGVDAALSSRFNVANKEQQRSTIKALRRVAYSEFGIPLMPNHRLKNHFTSAAWIVYYTGIGEAAAQAEDGDLLFELIAQQVRNAVINKTFYEVMDTDTGLAWRWPDQTWHAAGFVSLFLNGIFGIRYQEDGLTFVPYIPKPLKGISLTGLHYRKVTLNITTQGWGAVDCIFLDGEEITRLSPQLTGTHSLIFRCREK